MNIGLILAGGVDARFEMDIPKQFVNVDNKPIIIYTMTAFQKHPDIDEIVVVCVDGWQEMVKAYSKQYGIDKLTDVIAGGKTTQESTYLGLKSMEDRTHSGDLVVVHDAIRPMVSERLISTSIKACEKNGMGVSATYIMDTIVRTDGNQEGYESMGRNDIMKIQTPQTFQFDKFLELHERAIKEKKVAYWDNVSMLTALGEKIYFAEGSDFNLRINTTEDVEMFKALYNMKE